MAFPEENCELEKQIGCMSGIFQIFDRRHLLTGRRFNRHNQKRLPQGDGSLKSRDNPVEQKKSSPQATLDKTLSKSMTENSSLSMESSRASCSSSSCSSFSSVNETFFTEKPSKQTLNPKTAPPSYCEFRDIVKESINREPHGGGLTVKTAPPPPKEEELPTKKYLKHKDSPRPLLISKSNDGTYVIGIDRSIKHEYGSNCNNSYYTPRFSCDGRELQDCTKTSTGLRDLPRLSLDSRKESLTRNYSCGNNDSPGHKRSNSLIARLMGLDLFPDEISNPVESLRNRRDNSLSVFSQSNTRENDVQNLVKTKTFMRIGTESAPWRQQEKNGGKKMAFEIEKRLRELDLHAKERLETKRGGESSKPFDSPVVIMQPIKYRNNATSSRVTLVAGGHLTGLRKLQTGSLQERRKPKQSSRESGANSPRTPSSSSPRISQKNGDLYRKSRPSSPSSPKRNLVSDLGSPRSKFRSKSSQTKKNLAQKSAEDPFTPILKEKISDKEIAVVSPVSVLDASFYHDELSPAKRLSDSFRDGETCTSEESWNAASLPETPPSNQIKSENIETLIQKLEQLSSANDELPCGDPIVPSSYNPKNKNHEYIFEILTASGLLRKDPSFIVQLWGAEFLINPDLFFVLEQTKSENKINRKLTFDVVNEILGEKLERSISSMVSSERLVCTKKVGGDQLLEELCTKIDKIQTGAVKGVEFDGGDENEGDDFEISGEETIRQMRGWDKFETELQGMVLEIERSIFKDLVDEVIELESFEVIKQRKIRRQLF